MYLVLDHQHCLIFFSNVNDLPLTVIKVGKLCAVPFQRVLSVRKTGEMGGGRPYGTDCGIFQVEEGLC